MKKIKYRKAKRRNRAINNLIGYYVIMPMAVLIPMMIMFIHALL